MLPDLLYRAQKKARPFTSNRATQGTQHMNNGTSGVQVLYRLTSAKFNTRWLEGKTELGTI